MAPGGLKFWVLTHFPSAFHVSKDGMFCFWTADVLKENFCLQLSWCLILLSWHLCPLLVTGWAFLVRSFSFQTLPKICSNVWYLSLSLSNDVSFVKGLSWKMKWLDTDWTFSDNFKHVWVLAQKAVSYKPDFYATCYRFLCMWERRTLGTNGAGPLTEYSHGWLIQIISLHSL